VKQSTQRKRATESHEWLSVASANTRNTNNAKQNKRNAELDLKVQFSGLRKTKRAKATFWALAEQFLFISENYSGNILLNLNHHYLNLSNNNHYKSKANMHKSKQLNE
jgi:hypothetical protein